MPWIALTLNLPANDVARAEALLELAGALSVAIADGGDSPILEPAPGAEPLWPDVTINALFEAGANADAILSLLAPVAGRDVRIETLSDADVAAGIPEPIRRVEIDDSMTIVPAEEFDASEASCLGLHMGLGFGTGQHPTTRLCLKWLTAHDIRGLSVLDYGAGSGVLALAALRLGASRATAVDNEAQALIATERNAVLNGLTANLSITAPEHLADGAYDLILANILVSPLLELAEAFAARQAAGGRIVMSGILSEQVDSLEARYADAGYAEFACEQLEDWALLTATRAAGYDR